jgi:CubicO group peptidase (beta-lactamase class C family)
MHVFSETFDPTEADRDLIAALSEFVPVDMQTRNTPGVSIALGRQGRLIWRAAFGSADLARGTPMSVDHVFKSGSVGKTITGTAIMQLVERGVLALDDAASARLPFALTNPLGGEVTIRHLLTHTAGLGSSVAGSVSAASVFKPLAEAVPYYLNRTTDPAYGGLMPTWIASPGVQHGYSNLGMALLGLIVEHTNPEKLSYHEYIQAHIFDALGMGTSQYPVKQDGGHVRPDIWARMMTGHMRMGRAAMVTPDIYFEQSPAGAFVSTPSDHLKFLMAFEAGGALGEARILEKASVAAMLTSQGIKISIPGTASEQGLIWWLNFDGERLVRFDHGGAHMFGFTNQGAVWPAERLAMSVSTNVWNIGNFLDATSQEIEKLVDDWVRLGGSSGRTRQVSWAWKLSYVQGGRFIESCNAGLGLRDPLTLEDARAAAASIEAQRERPVNWDRGGFLEGARAMLEVPATPEGIHQFVARCPLSKVEIDQALHILEGPPAARLAPSLWTAPPV